MNPWQVLGVGHDVTVADLRRHYAALIKQFRPETHPQDFARIREAYEFALQHARRREAEVEELEARRETVAVDAEAEGHADADASIDVRTPVDIEPRAPVRVVVAAMLPGEPAAEAEPDLAAAFHALRALAQAATDDQALLPALGDLLRARSLASLDDSQALEYALMRWFAESDEPPLALLFETGRSFDWHAHIVRLSNWLTPWALRRMETLLALSRDQAYARHFSGNARLRALHSPAGARPLFVFRPAALEARHWAQRWFQQCELAQVPALGAGPSAQAEAQLRAVASTDVLAGLLVLPLATDVPSAVLAVAAIAAIAWAGRRALQAIARLPPTHRVRAAARAVLSNGMVTLVVTALLAIPSFILLDAYPVVGFMLLAPVIATGVAAVVTMLWRVAAWFELLAVLPLLWREAVDRLEFERFLRPRTPAAADPSFGARLGFGARLLAIRAALRLQKRELAAHERPLRAVPFRLVVISRGRPGNGR